jgi:Copper type II ascorbate-dependent monooxygenase, C-terminal domain
MDHDVTLFGIGPHMHQLGVHMKAVAHSSLMGDVVLSDKPYDFEVQTVYPLTTEVRMKAGDTITVECTYLNATGKTVVFGESTLDEMCFAGTYGYPAGEGAFVCVL